MSPQKRPLGGATRPLANDPEMDQEADPALVEAVAQDAVQVADGGVEEVDEEEGHDPKLDVRDDGSAVAGESDGSRAQRGLFLSGARSARISLWLLNHCAANSSLPLSAACRAMP